MRRRNSSASLRDAGRVSAARWIDLASIPAARGVSSREVPEDLRGEE